MKCVKKSEGAITDSRERTADKLFSNIGTVALAVEGSDPSITEDNFVPTARCTQDTKKKQLVTGSSPSKITVLCMPSPSRASNESVLPCLTILRKSTQEGTTLYG